MRAVQEAIEGVKYAAVNLLISPFGGRLIPLESFDMVPDDPAVLLGDKDLILFDGIAPGFYGEEILTRNVIVVHPDGRKERVRQEIVGPVHAGKTVSVFLRR